MITGGAVKSIQTGSISITTDASGRGTNTQTVNAVNTAKAVVLLNGAYSATAQMTISAKAVLTNATTVTASCNTSYAGAGTITVDYTVIEYY